MVILFVSPHYGERGEMPKGGVGMYLRRVAGALKEFGHTPMILTTGTKDAHCVDNGIEIFYVHCPDIKMGIRSVEMVCSLFYRSGKINKKISEILRQRDVDIIQFASILGLAALYFKPVPAVMRLSTYSRVYRDYREDKVKIDLDAMMERIAAGRCNAVFAPSTVIAEIFSKAVGRNVSVIESPYWEDCKEWDDSIYYQRLSGKKYFLYYGRLVMDKGIFVLAECLQRFLERNKDFYFVCCGINSCTNKANAANTLKKSAGNDRDRFIFINSLPHTLLFPIIQNAQFVVFPSLIDNFPNACIEAMHLGQIVIGTDGTSLEQLIEDGYSGLLCTPGDAGSLLNKMNEAVAMDDVQRAQMSRNAERRAGKLAPEYTVKKLLRFYQYVIDNNRHNQ